MRSITITSPCHSSAIDRGHQSPVSYFRPHPNIFRQLNFPCDRKYSRRLLHSTRDSGELRRSTVRPNAKTKSDKEYEISLRGNLEYLEEQDVVTFLDPPKELIPLDQSSYNPASYLWKKIEDIPEERRHHLLSMLNSRLLSRAWEVAGKRYEDPKLVKKTSSILLSLGDCVGSLEFWKCRTSGAPLSISWVNFFEKAIFCCRDGRAYGRLIGVNPLAGIMNSSCPLYFSLEQVNEVMSTEEPCDLAYEFGDGIPTLPEIPQGFPKPAKHPWPFNDQVVIYVRHLGPGVLVGQAWQEGRDLKQVPKKLCGEILMVKNYFAIGKS